MKILSKCKNIFVNYIKNNFKEYTLVSLLFIIGLFISVLVINNCDNDCLEEISAYINDFIDNFKNAESINKIELFIDSVKNNIFLTLILWLAGTTVIGVPIVLIIILLRGLSLGYTISIVTYTLGTFKGLEFCFISILLKNLLFIPALLTLGVSSIKLYKSIIQDKRKENIKIEIIRHCIISILMLLILILSSLVDAFISAPFTRIIVQYF